MSAPFEVNTAGVIDRPCTCVIMRFGQSESTKVYRDRTCVVHPR